MYECRVASTSNGMIMVLFQLRIFLVARESIYNTFIENTSQITQESLFHSLNSLCLHLD